MSSRQFQGLALHHARALPQSLAGRNIMLPTILPGVALSINLLDSMMQMSQLLQMVPGLAEAVELPKSKGAAAGPQPAGKLMATSKAAGAPLLGSTRGARSRTRSPARSPPNGRLLRKCRHPKCWRWEHSNPKPGPEQWCCGKCHSYQHAKRARNHGKSCEDPNCDNPVSDSDWP